MHLAHRLVVEAKLTSCIHIHPYVYIHTDIHTYLHIRIHAYMHPYMDAYIRLRMQVCMYVCMYVRTSARLLGMVFLLRKWSTTCAGFCGQETRRGFIGNLDTMCVNCYYRFCLTTSPATLTTITTNTSSGVFLESTICEHNGDKAGCVQSKVILEPHSGVCRIQSGIMPGIKSLPKKKVS